MAQTSPQGSPSAKATKNERREAAREKARQFREAQKKRARRRRLIIQGSVVAGVIAVGVVITLLVVALTRPATMPANMASNGIAFTKGLQPVLSAPRDANSAPVAHTSNTGNVVVDVYIDFMCPFCQQFEQTNGQYLSEQTAAGNIDLVIHPIEILDRLSQGTNYSTRAAAAAASVATYAPNAFLTFQSRLYDDDVKPAEQTKGLTDDQLITYAREAIGDSNPGQQQQVEDSIRSGEFKSWVGLATKASDVETQGTPLVLIDGQQWQSSAQTQADLYKDFPDALRSALKAKGIDPDTAAQ